MATRNNSMNIKSYLSKYDNAIDAYPIESECTNMYVLRADGAVVKVRYDLNNLNISNKLRNLDGCFNYKTFALTENQSVVDISDQNTKSVFPEQYKIITFAVVYCNYTTPFVVVVFV